MASLFWGDRPYLVELVAICAPLIALAVGLGAVVMFIARRRRIALEGAIACTVTLFVCWMGITRFEVTDDWPVGERLRVLTYNAYGRRSENDDAYFDWMRKQDADLVCLIEPPIEFIQKREWIELS